MNDDEIMDEFAKGKNLGTFDNPTGYWLSVRKVKEIPIVIFPPGLPPSSSPYESANVSGIVHAMGPDCYKGEEPWCKLNDIVIFPKASMHVQRLSKYGLSAMITDDSVIKVIARP